VTVALRVLALSFAVLTIAVSLANEQRSTEPQWTGQDRPSVDGLKPATVAASETYSSIDKISSASSLRRLAVLLHARARHLRDGVLELTALFGRLEIDRLGGAVANGVTGIADEHAIAGAGAGWARAGVTAATIGAHRAVLADLLIAMASSHGGASEYPQGEEPPHVGLLGDFYPAASCFCKSAWTCEAELLFRGRSPLRVHRAAWQAWCTTTVPGVEACVERSRYFGTRLITPVSAAVQ
jgi:hypothetical protein